MGPGPPLSRAFGLESCTHRSVLGECRRILPAIIGGVQLTVHERRGLTAVQGAARHFYHRSGELRLDQMGHTTVRCPRDVLEELKDCLEEGERRMTASDG